MKIHNLEQISVSTEGELGQLNEQIAGESVRRVNENLDNQQRRIFENVDFITNGNVPVAKIKRK